MYIWTNPGLSELLLIKLKDVISTQVLLSSSLAGTWSPLKPIARENGTTFAVHLKMFR